MTATTTLHHRPAARPEDLRIRVEARLASWLAAHSITALRISLGPVIAW